MCGMLRVLINVTSTAAEVLLQNKQQKHQIHRRPEINHLVQLCISIIRMYWKGMRIIGSDTLKAGTWYKKCAYSSDLWHAKWFIRWPSYRIADQHTHDWVTIIHEHRSRADKNTNTSQTRNQSSVQRWRMQYYDSLRFVAMYTHDGTEIQTHGFTAQSVGFKWRLLNQAGVGLLPKQIIAHHSRCDVKLLMPVVAYVDLMWFYIKY